jgi:tetratricopeptide (TPR) repeat protein
LKIIRNIKTDLADEMFQVMTAQFESFYRRDYKTAFSYIEMAINKYPDSYYPYLTLFDIAEKIPDIDFMEKAIKFLQNANKKTHKYRQFIIRKSIFEGHKGDKKLAIRIIEEELSDMPQEYIERYRSYINGISQIQIR